MTPLLAQVGAKTLASGVLAQVPVETADKLAGGYRDNTTGWVWALAVLGLVAVAAYCARLVGIINAFRTELSEVQEKRIKDRDQFQAELKELARTVAAIVERNSQGLFLLQQVVEEKRRPRRAAAEPPKGAAP